MRCSRARPRSPARCSGCRPTAALANGESVDSAFGMLHGLYWLASNMAEQRPLALLVDDLHWADAETLRFLNYLAPRLDGLALVLVGSARPEEMPAGELPRLATAPETTLVRPQPLSEEGTARLCERRLGREVAPEFAARLPRGHRRQPLLPRGAAARRGRTRPGAGCRGRRQRARPRSGRGGPGGV